MLQVIQINLLRGTRDQPDSPWQVLHLLLRYHRYCRMWPEFGKLDMANRVHELYAADNLDRYILRCRSNCSETYRNEAATPTQSHVDPLRDSSRGKAKTRPLQSKTR